MLQFSTFKNDYYLNIILILSSQCTPLLFCSLANKTHLHTCLCKIIPVFFLETVSSWSKQVTKTNSNLTIFDLYQLMPLASFHNNFLIKLCAFICRCQLLPDAFISSLTVDVRYFIILSTAVINYSKLYFIDTRSNPKVIPALFGWQDEISNATIEIKLAIAFEVFQWTWTFCLFSSHHEAWHTT